ncbi:MAG: Holliday junction branch migration protein RuvA [Peptococcaceae bacterium]|nr:Holliday junction branch migration protein RuvA [Peptococcaceae bacterium]
MIDFVEGLVAEKLPQAVVIKTGGLGLKLFASVQTLSQLPPAGSPVLIYSFMVVKEDEISLYGFSSREEREFFQLLIQVSGVGPKLGLSVLSAYPVERLKQAIVLGDLNSLTGISGIGKKTAQRLILELKDKIGKDIPLAGQAEGAAAAAGDELSEAMSALLALGYTQGEVARAFTKLDTAGLGTEELIKQGLKQLARF